MIEVSDLNYTYRRGRKVLNGVTVNFAEGMIHGLLGRNGSGKTTMFKLICGLLTPAPGSGGRVAIDGDDPSTHRPSVLERIFILPEEFDLPQVSIDRYVKYTAPFYPGFDPGAFDDHCRELNVARRQNLDNMSMGERKKAYIAFALACKTPYILMDEPTNALDIPAKSVFRRLLSAHAAQGYTVIISTHQVADLEKLIDNVVILDDNGIALNASTARIESRLCFGSPSGNDEVLYSQESLYGVHGVWPNVTGQETTTDLELLFNAVLHNRSRIIEIMNN